MTSGDRFIAADDGAVGDHGAIDTLPDRAAVKIVRAELRDIIATEGPVATRVSIRIRRQTPRPESCASISPGSDQGSATFLFLPNPTWKVQLSAILSGQTTSIQPRGRASVSAVGTGRSKTSHQKRSRTRCARSGLRSPGIDEALLRETAVLFDTRLGAKVRARLEDVRDRHSAAVALPA